GAHSLREGEEPAPLNGDELTPAPHAAFRISSFAALPPLVYARVRALEPTVAARSAASRGDEPRDAAMTRTQQLAAAGRGAAVAARVAGAGTHHAAAAAVALDRVLVRVEERGLARRGSVG